MTFYEQVGGRAFFERLVDAFYEGVWTDDVLRPMYPQDDYDGARERLTGFLEQYWGGPGTYSQERGHPRLRMRHMPFPIGPEARDRWLHHMRAAVDVAAPPPLLREELLDYLDRAAHAMVNRNPAFRADVPPASGIAPPASGIRPADPPTP